MSKRRGLMIILLAMLVVMLAIPAQAAKVKLNKTKATIKVGKTIKLKVTGTKAKIKWSTSNKKIATVSNKGVVKGKKAGKTDIIAKVGKKKLKCKITVKAAPLPKHNSSIQFTENPITVNIGETKNVGVVCNGYALTGSSHFSKVNISWGEWQDTNTAILSITGESKGEDIITVSDKNVPTVRNILSVTVLSTINSVSFADSSKNLTLNIGDTAKINYSIAPPDASDMSLDWTTSNDSVATVDSNGTVTGVGAGTAIITATAASGVNDTSTVTVRDVTITTPTLPITVSRYSLNKNLISTCKVEKIEFEKSYYASEDNFTVSIWITGVKTYDQDPAISSSCIMGWKLYDSNNIVVKSGTFYSGSVCTGERFRNQEYIGFGLKEGTYRLELLDVK